MITSLRAAREVLTHGHTIAWMTEFGGSGRFHWAVTEDGEGVSPPIVKRLAEKGEITVIARDLAGEPMQYAKSSEILVMERAG